MKRKLCVLTLSAGLALSLIGADENNTDSKTKMDIPPQASIKALRPEINKEAFDFLPDIVAVVGDQKVTKEELVRIMKARLNAMREKYQIVPEEQYKDFAQSILPEMVQRRLVLKLAADDGYKVTQEIGNQAYNKFAEEYKKSPESKNMSFEEALKKDGVTAEEAKKQMAEDKIVQTWVDEKIASGIQVSDAEAKSFYDTNKDRYFKIQETVSASHILIKPKSDKPEDWKAAEETAKKVYDDIINKKADFKAEAEKYSDCPSKKNGGDLGKFAKGQMVPEFERACWDIAKSGKIGDMTTVKTQFGWHVIKVTGYEKSGFVPYDDKLIAEIKNQLKNQRIIEKVDSMVAVQIKKLNPMMSVLSVNSIASQQ